jgi:hypothetical protein
MLNIPGSGPGPARHSRATSAPIIPSQDRLLERTPSTTSSTNIPPGSDSTIRVRLPPPLHPSAVIVPRKPNLSDLASYYPRADPFSDATTDPDGGFRHWSDGELDAGSPWETPRRGRRRSDQSGASPTVSRRLTFHLKQAGLRRPPPGIATTAIEASSPHTNWNSHTQSS